MHSSTNEVEKIKKELPISWETITKAGCFTGKVPTYILIWKQETKEYATFITFKYYICYYVWN